MLGRVRTYKDGKLKISRDDGGLLHSEDGIAISGDVRNSWAGVSTLQSLFIQEHNVVCDALKVSLLPSISTFIHASFLLTIIKFPTMMSTNTHIHLIQGEYPDLEDEHLYRHARLVTAAVIAKIHTIDWTVDLLKTDTLLAGMRANWYRHI